MDQQGGVEQAPLLASHASASAELCLTSAHIRPPPSRTMPDRRCLAVLLEAALPLTATPRRAPPLLLPLLLLDTGVASAGGALVLVRPASCSSASSRSLTLTSSAKASEHRRISTATSSALHTGTPDGIGLMMAWSKAEGSNRQ